MLARVTYHLDEPAATALAVAGLDVPPRVLRAHIARGVPEGAFCQHDHLQRRGLNDIPVGAGWSRIALLFLAPIRR